MLPIHLECLGDSWVRGVVFEYPVDSMIDKYADLLTSPVDHVVIVWLSPSQPMTRCDFAYGLL